MLIWHAIQYTKETLGLDIFDFEGSMIESVERVRRDCGGVQRAYSSIAHTPSLALRFSRTSSTAFSCAVMLRITCPEQCLAEQKYIVDG